MADFISHFSTIPDPRIERSKKYPLIEILFLSMAAVVGDAGGWEEIEDFGRDRLEWLRRFLPYENGNRRSAIHMVSAWVTENKEVLGQVKVADKSNEITAIPELLDMLAIKGCIVTIDAMGCQTAIAEKIIEKGGDYVLAVKENQPSLNEGVRLVLKEMPRELQSDYFEEIMKDHGRIETRRCRQVAINFEWLPAGIW